VLLAFLQTMSLDDGPQPIELVRAGDWHRTDPDVRFEIPGWSTPRSRRCASGMACRHSTMDPARRRADRLHRHQEMFR
jgi:hypothetical protein